MPASRPFRPLLRGAVAGLTTELVLVGGVELLLGGVMDSLHVPAELVLYAATIGLTGGLVFGLAELCATRTKLVVGILVGLALLPLVLLAGHFTLLRLSAGTIEATREVLGAVRADTWTGLVLFALAALLLHGPLLWIRGRDLGLLPQIDAGLVGGVLLVAGVCLYPEDWARSSPYPALLYLILVFGRAVVFPLGLLLGDRLATRALTWLGHDLPRPALPVAGQRRPRQGLRLACYALLALALLGAAATSMAHPNDPAPYTLRRIAATLDLPGAGAKLGTSLCRGRWFASALATPTWTPYGLPDAMLSLTVTPPVQRLPQADSLTADLEAGLTLLVALVESGDTTALWPLLERLRFNSDSRLLLVAEQAQRAAAHDDPDGLAVLGMLYAAGIVVEHDWEAARDALERAAELGSTRAKVWLAALLLPPSRDPQRSHLLRSALDDADDPELEHLLHNTLSEILNRRLDLRRASDPLARVEVYDANGQPVNGTLVVKHDYGDRVLHVEDGRASPDLYGRLPSWSNASFTTDPRAGRALATDYDTTITSWEPDRMVLALVPKPPPSRVTIAGRIKGKDVAGVRVGIRSGTWKLDRWGHLEPGWLETETNAAGEFTFENLPVSSASGFGTTGFYTLRALGRGSEPRAHRTALVSLPQQQPVTLHLAPTRHVTVRLRDERGLPREGRIRVTLSGAHGWSHGSRGAAETTIEASTGALTVRGEVDGYDPVERTLPADDLDADVTLVLRKR